MGRIEDKILDILTKQDLNEEVEYEVVGGPTPSAILQAPLDYTKPVQKATVPQTNPIPGVGQPGGNQEGEANEPITDVVDALREDEDEPKPFDKPFDKDDDDDEKDDKDDKDGKEDLEETFASLLARLAEEDDLTEEEEEGGEISLKTKEAGEPKVVLPTVDSKVENPEALVEPAPGVQVAEDEAPEGGETSKIPNPLGPENDNGGDPKVTLPVVDSKLREPEALVTPAPGAKAPDQDFGDEEKPKTDDVKEDLAAIFSGYKLSEQAMAKAATIFQAAVTRRVNEEKVRVQKIATKKLKEAFNVLKARADKKQEVYESKLTGQVDRYLNYVVENWMGENRLAVERGIRAELAESFINGLKSLFVEHYIEIPESKVDVVATLGKKVTKLESKLNEAIETNVKMRASLNAYRKEEVVRAVSAGLADTQREKLKGLAEGVEYTTRKEFAEKLMQLKEAYFSKAPKTLKKEEQPLMESKKTTPTNDEMALYTQTLSKMKKD